MLYLTTIALYYLDESLAALVIPKIRALL